MRLGGGVSRFQASAYVRDTPRLGSRMSRELADGFAGYALSHEDVWSWRWAEGGVSGDAMLNAHFSPDGVVIRTSRSEAPGHEKP